MTWTEKKLMILSYLLSPFIAVYSVTESFLDWRDKKLDEIDKEKLKID